MKSGHIWINWKEDWMNSFANILKAELSQALGWTFIHSLWQGCLLMLLFMVLSSVFKFKSLSRYWGALLTMSLLLLTSAFTLSQYMGSSEFISQFNDASVLIVNAVQPMQDFEGTNIFKPYLSIIACIWLAGAMFYALRLCGGFIQIYRLKKTAVSQVPAEWMSRFNHLLTKVKIDKTVMLLQSAKADVPMVLGYFKPVILLPVGMIAGLSTAQVEAILLHELSHIKRHDFLINILQSIIEVVFYYHPVVWWLSAQARQEREHCCDDQIIAYGVNKITYANALTNVQHISFTQNKLTMGLANDKNDLLNRIKRLVDGNDHTSTNFYTKGISLIVLMTFLMGFSWYQQEHLSEEPETVEPVLALASVMPVQEVPMFRIPPLDTVIIDEIQPVTSGGGVKTTIVWTDDDGAVHEIIQDSAEDNHWVDKDDLKQLNVDLGSITEMIEDIEPAIDLDFKAVIDLDIEPVIGLDFDNDFLFEFRMDTLPEVKRAHRLVVEEELARVKESLNKMHEEFASRQENLTEVQIEDVKEKMREMEMSVREQMRELNYMQFEEGKVRERRDHREELISLREKERAIQLRELELQREEFSTQQIEQRMEAVEQELSRREAEMNALEEKYEDYQKELIKQLRADGYLKRGEDLDNFEMINDTIKVNGKSIDAKDIKVYRQLRDKHMVE
jgi:beta-lactamase regulating signal transducer with metallopeptidase domain